jgi:transcriptional regulator with PAS, ATPase and Fis domain
LRVLCSHSWEGNVRELQQVLERASILVQDDCEILAEDLHFPATAHKRASVGVGGPS